MSDKRQPAQRSLPKTEWAAITAETTAPPKQPRSRLNRRDEEQLPSRLFLPRAGFGRFCGGRLDGGSIRQAISSGGDHGIAGIYARKDLDPLGGADTCLNNVRVRDAVRAGDQHVWRIVCVLQQ